MRFSASRFLPAFLLAPALALSQTGVSDDRVSLPDGPGSRGGLGENVSTVGNMGLMTYTVSIPVPDGFPGLTPQVDLDYSSGAGQGFLGVGWTMDSPSIERMTARGLPTYAATDLFVADGGTELVEVPGSTPPTYRARFENGFIRYRWENRGNGQQGYWTAEYPDGRISYYGANRMGTSVPTAREGNAAGTFRYLLVETVDPFDHALSYAYTADPGGASLLETVGWLHNAQGMPSYTVTYQYEARPDAISDGKPGYDQRITRRLKTVTVRKGTTVLRTATLAYEDNTTAGFSSRLQRVTQTGVQNTQSPLVFTFEYSRVLGGVCTGVSCRDPFIVTLAGLGGPLSSGNATLLDINGDALPDILETPVGAGRHSFRVANLDSAGNHTFGTAVQSAVTSASVLSAANVVPLDANGDGFTDLINTRNGQVLYNLGVGDWMSQATVGSVNVLPDLELDAMDGVRTIQFIDYDNDKRIDVISASANNPTAIYRNAGDAGFVAVANVQDIGRGFDEGLQLQDMNGDGLMDPVAIVGTQVQFRLNLGYGRWSDWTTVAGFSLSAGQVAQAEFEDINGDGLTDVVVVQGISVSYALNRNGSTFSPMETLTSSATLNIPNRDAGTTVLYADMNGNGSTDVVWVNSGSSVKYLELFPIRPNLLSKVDNGLGAVSEISYVTAVEQLAGAATPWAYRIPHSMLMVSRVDVYEQNANVHDVVDYLYRDAWYDGVDKSFRGFEEVAEVRLEDETQEGGTRTSTYDLGITDRYRAGLLLTQEETTGDHVVRSSTRTYADCMVAEAPNTGTRPVRRVCLTQEDRVIQEGRPQAEFLTMRTRYQYDGYGNTTRVEERGVVQVGGGQCQACSGAAGAFGKPCGPLCLGDESFTDTTYVAPTPTGRWILRSPATVRRYGVADTTAYRETQYFYDGPAFEGLPLGQLDKGAVTRVAERASENGGLVDVERNRLDSHGNVVEFLDALGTPNGNGHRAVITYDALGLRITRVDNHTQDSTGPYQLRREYQYDPTWDLPSEATSWFLVRNGTAATPRNSQFFLYDNLARVAALADPGDNPVTPTESYAYTSASPVSSVRTLRRGQAGMSPNKEELDCLDGYGRAFQIRIKVAAGRWVVRDHTVFNPDGAAVRLYQPWESASDACEPTPPTGVKFTAITYDALGRVLSHTQPDGLVVTTRYLPLASESRDELDDDAQSPQRGTPDITRQNGLGLTYGVERKLSEQGMAEVFTYTYDQHGRLTSLSSPDGTARTQTWDLRGRPVTVSSTDEGTTTFTHDDLGQRTSRTDARNRTVRAEFDGLGRPTSVYEDGARAATEHVMQYDTHPDCPAGHCTNGAGRLVRTLSPTHLGPALRVLDRDLRGRTIGELHTLLGVTMESRQSLDGQGTLTQARLPGGITLDYVNDGADRLTAVTGIVDSITYTPAEQVAQVGLHNTTTFHRAYTDRLLPASMRLERGSEVFLNRALTRDPRSRITGVTESAPAALPSISAAYTRDAHGRVTAAAYGAAASPSESLAFAFDGQDNILSATSTRMGSPANVGTYGLTGRRVTTAGSLAFTYDAAGNVTGRGTDTLDWDAYGRLASVSRGGQTFARYAYDASNNRILKDEDGSLSLYVSQRLEVHDGVSTVWVAHGAGTVARRLSTELMAQLYPDVAPATGTGSLTPAPDTRITAADAWLLHAAAEGILTLSGGTPRLTAAHTLRAAAARVLVGTGVTDFYTSDERDSTLMVHDEQGNLLGQAETFPFGALRVHEGLPAQAFLFTGKERDRTGFVYFGARYLDVEVGRWLSPDPLFMPMGASALATEPAETLGTYAYVGNDPLDNVDPMGMKRGNKNKGDPAATKGNASNKGGNSNKAKKSGKGKPKAPDASPSPTPAPSASPAPAKVNTSVSSKDLQSHEKLGGHAIDRHVGKTVEQLQSRLDSQKNIAASSSYSSLESSATATSAVLGSNEAAIRNFLSGNANRVALTAPVPANSGTVLRRDGTVETARTGLVVIVKSADTGSGYRVLTSYPNNKP